MKIKKFSYLALSQSNFVCIIINWHIFARTVWLSIVDLHSIYDRTSWLTKLWLDVV
jgi:hypothetical protein